MHHNKTLAALLLGTAFTLAAHAGTDSFIITVKTDNTGTSADTEFTMPINSSYSYDYTIDCDSDGTPEAANVSTEYTCSYETAGTYTVTIDGTFPYIYFDNAGDSAKLLSVEQWGTTPWVSMERSFWSCSNLVINATDTPNLSAATSMDYTFAGAANIGNGTGSWEWDVSHITTMRGLFINAYSFDEPIGSWDVSHVTDMQSMFPFTAFNQDIGNWDVSSVTNMNGMFNYATLFDQDIGGWDVSKVQDIRSMFSAAYAFNQDISDWDISNVTNIIGMFSDAFAFDQDLGDWNFVNTYPTVGDGPALSVSNYDALLEGLAATATLSGRTFDAGGNTYCEGAAARQSLIDNLGWTIIDGGENCEYYIDSPRHVTVESGTTEVLTVSRANEPSTYVGMEEFWIVGGVDKDLFELDWVTGTLTFKSPPDFNNPQDSNGDNIEANNDYTWRDYQTFSVEVTDSGSATPNVTPLIMYLLN